VQFSGKCFHPLSSPFHQVLFAALQGREAFLRPPYHQLRHPLVFYYNHPAVLYINKLRVAGILEDGIDQFYEQVIVWLCMCVNVLTKQHSFWDAPCRMLSRSLACWPSAFKEQWAVSLRGFRVGWQPGEC